MYITIVSTFVLGLLVGGLAMFLELTVSHKDWVSYREWSKKYNKK